ncbi:hypothetical protein [Kitasatospora sp. NPDC057223]|uniref:hypothetical protein n=1 Tax=Kitasatospora sp. NPDC057223 TaxID=3346055 RepID=UPI003629A272
MRTISTAMPNPGPQAGPRALSGPEATVVVIIMTLAVALALADLPMFGALEFLGGAVYLACRTVKGLRDPRPGTPGAI